MTGSGRELVAGAGYGGHRRQARVPVWHRSTCPSCTSVPVPSSTVLHQHLLQGAVSGLRRSTGGTVFWGVTEVRDCSGSGSGLLGTARGRRDRSRDDILTYLRSLLPLSLGPSGLFSQESRLASGTGLGTRTKVILYGTGLGTTF